MQVLLKPRRSVIRNDACGLPMRLYNYPMNLMAEFDFRMDILFQNSEMILKPREKSFSWSGPGLS